MLHCGTWLGTAVIAVGVVLALAGPAGESAATSGGAFLAVGIALIIFLPVARLLLMAITFLRQGDYRFGAIAMLVLVIIAVGAMLGILFGKG
jgi:uncharacterized membrane protein